MHVKTGTVNPECGTQFGIWRRDMMKTISAPNCKKLMSKIDHRQIIDFSNKQDKKDWLQ